MLYNTLDLCRKLSLRRLDLALGRDFLCAAMFDQMDHCEKPLFRMMMITKVEDVTDFSNLSALPASKSQCPWIVIAPA